MKQIIIILVALSILPPISASADIGVSLELDRTEATLSDSIEMIVNISGTRSSDNPVIQGIEKFSLSKGGTSSKMQIINGSYSSSIEYTFYLQPMSAGTFHIGPARIKIDGKVYKSNKVKLIVAKSPTASGGSRPSIFLTAKLSSYRAYVEEQVVCTLRLYHQPRISDISLTLPEVKDITIKRFGDHKEYQTNINNEKYRVIEVKYSLVPSKAGKYTIEPASMNMTVYKSARRSSKRLNDLFFRDPAFPFSQGRTMRIACDSLKFEALSLPTKGKPLDFGGLVGKYSISSTLQPSRIKAGESVTLTVILSGWGNVNRMPDLKMPDIYNVKLYKDQPALRIEPGEKGFEGEKTMKWAIVPEEEGEYQIPSLSISYFDTNERTYQRIKTTPHLLAVSPSGSDNSVVSLSSSRKDISVERRKKLVEELGRDILPIHSSVRDLASGSFFDFPGWLSWFVILFPALIYTAFLGGYRFTRMTPQRSAQSKSSKAAAVCLKECSKFDIDADQLSDVIRNYINNRFGMKMGSLTSGEVANILKHNGCSDETTKEMEDIILNLENLIYTGQGKNSCNISQNIAAIIKKIEKEIR
ncbi:MAG: BatD family protein [Spirochaetota bacterium]|nr:BatD family protein [Spirochaetota bacterium]